MTTSEIIRRAEDIADIRNTSFLTHEELTSYLNEGAHFVFQQIVNANLDLFTAKASLVGSNGRYPLPWDFWQMKSIKNPFSGQQIIRKTDSFSKFSSGYTISNNDLVIEGINPGPIEITYYRKPFYLSIPNKTIEDVGIKGEIVDTSENNVLWVDEDNKLTVWTPKGNLVTTFEKEEDKSYHLVRDEYILVEDEESTQMLTFYGGKVWESEKNPDFYYKSDNGLVYFGYKKGNNVEIYKLDNKLITLPGKPNYIRIGDDWYEAPKNAFPIGYFDDRPAYTSGTSLFLINKDKSVIEETLDLPIMGYNGVIKYGLISNNKIYSNIPDTELNMPNNILYDLIAFRLAVYFLCKQNAESSGVENIYKAMEQQFFQSLDCNSLYPRLNNVR